MILVPRKGRKGKKRKKTGSKELDLTVQASARSG